MRLEAALLRNVGEHLPINRAQHLRRLGPQSFLFNHKIVCKFILIFKEMCVNTEFWRSFTDRINSEASVSLSSPSVSDCRKQCSRMRVHVGRNAAPDCSPRLLTSDRLGLSRPQFLSCLSEWFGLVQFDVFTPLFLGQSVLNFLVIHKIQEINLKYSLFFLSAMSTKDVRLTGTRSTIYIRKQFAVKRNDMKNRGLCPVSVSSYSFSQNWSFKSRLRFGHFADIDL
jgi:hypothetical protein